jgi:hypothetical protein
MHNSDKEQDGIPREKTTCQLSVDMPLLSNTIVSFHSLQFTLSYSRDTTGVTDFSTQEGSRQSAELETTPPAESHR